MEKFKIYIYQMTKLKMLNTFVSLTFQCNQHLLYFSMNLLITYFVCRNSFLENMHQLDFFVLSFICQWKFIQSKCIFIQISQNIQNCHNAKWLYLCTYFRNVWGGNSHVFTIDTDMHCCITATFYTNVVSNLKIEMEILFC